MKKLALVFGLALMTFSTIQAQRIACVDVVQILEGMETYKTAQEELDGTAARWQQEMDQMRDEIRGLYNKYQSEMVLLSDDAKSQREDEIMRKEKEMRDFQKAKFGPDGALFKKRQELVRPIQDKVYKAIEDYAAQKGYDFIFDKGGSAGLLFTNPRYDKTAEVQEKVK
ncbi:MAG: OmpH family outer membrane protein [Saprospiraceae bacterium]